ncbi:MAG: sugar phosphate nucleotidyltransferase [Candidatus Daviesbacteria bacterium]|nr:sugar phosphate nucleotidyltransferase [Candidatus Daviesbacteria bacterium]
MRAILIAGGKGTRLYPYTVNFPKPLVPIGDKPVLEILIRRLRNYGFDHITLCVGHLSGLIEAYFKDGSWLGLKIDYSLEHEPLGTAGPIKLIGGYLPDTFLVANGDLLTDIDFKKIFEMHKKKKADLTVGTYKKEEKIELGVLKIKKGKVVDYLEKPINKYDISMGLYIFSRSVVDFIPLNQRYDMPSLVVELIKNKKNVVSYEHEGYWLDIGRPDDYQKAIEKYTEDPNSFTLDGDTK